MEDEPDVPCWDDWQEYLNDWRCKMNPYLVRKRWGKVFRGVFADILFGNRVDFSLIVNWSHSEYAVGLQFSWDVSRIHCNAKLILNLAILKVEIGIYPSGLWL